MIKILIGILIFIVAVFGLYLVALNTGKRRDASNFSGRLYAHRGLHSASNGVPENSLPAFALARASGYGVELDVQMTSDGKVVVFHDGDLKRMCGVDTHVYALTYDELQCHALLDTDEHIPLFEEVLEVLGDTHIVCEIKTPRSNSDMSVCEPVYQLIKDKPNICLESFNPFVIKWFRQNHPEIIRGQLASNFLKHSEGLKFPTRLILTGMMLNFLTQPDFIAFKHEDMATLSYKLCTRLYKPLRMAWTVRSKKAQDEIANDFDSFIFENYLAK